MEGPLHKRTRALLKHVWHTRHVKLNASSGTLSWSATAEDKVKGEVPLRGAKVERVEDSKLKRPFCFSVTTPATTLLFSAESAAELKRWLDEFSAAGASCSVASAASSSRSVGFGFGVASLSGGSMGSAHDDAGDASAATALPDAVTIEGWPVVGEELRFLNAADGCALPEMCSAQWLRLSGLDLPAVDADINGFPGVRTIPSATATTYTITADDVGCRLGCVARILGENSSSGGGATPSRWTLVSQPVAAAPASLASVVPLRLQAHEHHKYCDRRLRVCTAAGRFREGAVLLSVSPTMQQAGEIVWYRSRVVNEGRDVRSTPPRGDARVTPRSPSSPLPDAQDGSSSSTSGIASTSSLRGGMIRGGSSSSSSSSFKHVAAPHRGAIVKPTAWGSGLTHTRLGSTEAAASPETAAATSNSSSSGSENGPSANNLNLGGSSESGPGPLYRVIPRPVEHLPPAPPDHAPAAPIAELKRRLAVIAAPWPPPSAAAAGAPLPPSSAPTKRSASALHSASDSSSSSYAYPLFADDTGCVIAAAWVPAGCIAPAVVYPTAALSAHGGSSGNNSSSGSSSGINSSGNSSSGGYDLPPGMLLSRCVGPIEAAPPRARDIWIEGSPSVGTLLSGHYFYWGGREGDTEVAWVAINDDGAVTELKPPASIPQSTLSTYKAMAYTDIPGAAAATAVALDDAHPAVLRITAAHVGSLIKFKVRPVRADGDGGHEESSRPTAEITR